MAYKVRVGESWVNVTQPKVRVAGVWTNCTAVKARVNGAWSTVWQGQTNVRPNTFTADASVSWLNSANTIDGSFGDTSTDSSVSLNTSNDVSNFAYMTWAAQATTTPILKLQHGFIAQLGLDELACSTTIDYSTNSGSTWTNITTGNESTPTGPNASTINLPSSTNLSTVKVRFGSIKTPGTAGNRSRVQARCWDAYIDYT